jgi:hypothetical protein
MVLILAIFSKWVFSTHLTSKALSVAGMKLHSNKLKRKYMLEGFSQIQYCVAYVYVRVSFFYSIDPPFSVFGCNCQLRL